MGSKNNGGNRRKQGVKAVQEEPFPEQSGEYRPLFRFKGREFPLVKVVQF